MTQPRLGTEAQHQVAKKLISFMQQHEMIAKTEKEMFPAEAFQAFRHNVQASFFIDETSITPLMARLLFAIGYHHQPRRILVVGSYMGNALVWLAAAGCGPDAVYQAERAVGIDLNEEANRQARANFQNLKAKDNIEIIDGDAYQWIANQQEPFDLVFLDIDEPNKGKKGYLPLLQGLYPRLHPGTLILAHDIAVEKFHQDLQPYLTYVKNQAYFRKSASLTIDPAGLEVTLR